MTAADNGALLSKAARRARAAEVLLADGNCDPEDAVAPLLAGWRLVREVSDEEEPGPDERKLLDEGGKLDRRALRSHVWALREALVVAGGAKRPSIWRRFARPASRVAVVLGLIAMGTVLTLLAFPERRPELLRTPTEHGWRGAYHPDLLFLGKPLVRTDTEVDFDWRRGPPHPGGSADRFSVRWDTCLDLPQAVTVELRVGADDGVRAFIDGDQVVNDWSQHAFRRRSGARTLEPGTYHVVVEYYEKGGSARALAELIVPGDPEQEVPLSWLRVPDRPVDHEAPCEPSPASR